MADRARVGRCWCEGGTIHSTGTESWLKATSWNSVTSRPLVSRLLVERVL